ncbi:hypothetical protein OU798_10035 [Prolixibacteraceae bacterium Z1-6]|uniref:Uncharacterized protein n=1 Tax=Draconibacterium aestuarii TaxID=2998507 RepID=A0A9X3FDL5_9BACT|nr:hypothetical protein [Prolixibacteraceae bacterium Z1-6]
MKKFTLLIGLCLCFTTFISLNTRAQEATPPENFVVFEEFVSPSDMQAYKNAQEKVIDLWNQYEVKIPVYTYRNDDNAFYWVVPIENFSGLDDLYTSMMGVWKKMKEEGNFDADKEFRDLSTGRQTVLHWSKELSYHPSGEFGQSKEKPFVEWAFCYLKAGHEKEAAEAIKKYQTFYEGIDDNYEWDVYTVSIGHDTPCWILMVRAENELALLKLENELGEKYSEDFQKMWQNFAQHVRKFENKKGWFLPKWSSNWEME